MPKEKAVAVATDGSRLSLDAKLSFVKGAIGSISKDKTNPFAKAKYSSLSYIISQVRPIMSNYSIDFQIVSWTLKDNSSPVCYRAIVKLIDLETGETQLQRFDINLDTAQANKVQAFGATMTYGRRYIYAVLFDLEYDDDDPDSKSPTPEKPGYVKIPVKPPTPSDPSTIQTIQFKAGTTLVTPPQPDPSPMGQLLVNTLGAKEAAPISEAQRKRLFAISKDVGLSPESLKDFLVKHNYQSTSAITIAEYEEVCTKIREYGRKLNGLK